MPAEAASGRCVGAPDGKPHLVMARGAGVDADMGVAFFRQSVGTGDLHFLAAATLRQVDTPRHQQTLEVEHTATLNKGLARPVAMHKMKVRSA